VAVAHQRLLIITLAVAVVVAAVGIGVMAVATNDTDESVQDELGAAALGHNLAGGATTNVDRRVSNNLIFRTVAHYRIHQLWDDHNYCIEHDGTEYDPLIVDRDLFEAPLAVTTSTSGLSCLTSQSISAWKIELLDNNDKATGKWRNVGLASQIGQLELFCYTTEGSGVDCSRAPDDKVFISVP
jgi:hypothetical protein